MGNWIGKRVIVDEIPQLKGLTEEEREGTVVGQGGPGEIAVKVGPPELAIMMSGPGATMLIYPKRSECRLVEPPPDDDS